MRRGAGLRWPGLVLMWICVGSFTPGQVEAATESTPLPAKPHAEAPEDNVAALAEVWGSVRYFHPWLVSRDIDWDAALVEALPRSAAARTPEALSEAVNAMLSRLGDPVTHVAVDTPPAPPAASTHVPRALTRQVGDALVVDLNRTFGGLQELYPAVMALGPELAKARRVIVDLRAHGPAEAEWMGLALGFLEGTLPSEKVVAPATRALAHSGFKMHFGAGSGNYATTLETRLAPVFGPAPGASPRSIAFLVNGRTPLAPLLLAMRNSPRTFLVAQGALDEASAISTMSVPLPGGRRAVVRTSELVFPAGTPGLRADVSVPEAADSGEQGPAFQAALKLLRSGRPRSLARPASAEPALPTWRADNAYESMEYPAPEYRLLAVIRFWNAMRWFHPDRAALGDWGAVLPEFLRRARAATNAREYALTLYALAARVPDGHVFLAERGVLFRTLGEATAPVSVRYVEGRPLISELLDAQAVAATGLAVGDEVLAVGGRPVAERATFLRQHLAASNKEGLSRKVGDMLLAGPDGVQVEVAVQGADGRVKELRLPRARHWLAPYRQAPVSDAPWKTLDGGVGYVDLRQLGPGQVDAMLEALKDASALVLDLRGDPKGVAWALTPRLNVRKVSHAALIGRPLVSGGQVRELRFPDEIAPSVAPRYTGRTVLLVDERSVSQAEYTAMLLQAAAGARVVGSPTAGAVGDTTNVCLPGAICVLFTGQRFEYPDGRAVQGRGVQPDVEVRPTVKGLRAGRDEVLERALTLLRE
ncbi:S41 family peptidase [Myxococcaceae bacterium GXIMD 01537]